MTITVDWGTKVISVEKVDMTLVTSSPYDIYELDVDAFRLALKALEASVEGIPELDTHRHNTTVTVGGVTLARVVEIINGYTITFENGSYAVNLVGANNNVGDVLNLNQVSVRASNSAGLIESGTSGLTPAESAQLGTIDSVDTNVTAIAISVSSVDTNVSTLTSSVDNIDANVVSIASVVETINTTATNSSSVLANVDANVESMSTIVSNVDVNVTQLLSDVANVLASAGLTSEQSTMLSEIYEIHGLDPSKPLIVSSSSRTAGANIAQSVSTNTSNTTVTRT